jgi:hypothetical protein
LRLTEFKDEDMEMSLLDFRRPTEIQQLRQFRGVMPILDSDVEMLEQEKWLKGRMSQRKLDPGDTAYKGMADGAALMAHIEQDVSRCQARVECDAVTWRNPVLRHK